MFHPKRTPVLGTSAALILALSAPAFAQDRPGNDDTMPEAGTYIFDPSHSHIVFDYDHMGFSTSHGFITGVEGTITIDPEDLSSATVEASFPLSAIRTVSPELDQHIMGPDFFNVEGDPPLVSFKSTSVEPDDDDGEARVTGDFTMNGVTKPVTLEVDFTGAGVDPMSEQPTIGFSAETEIRRSDFNLGAFAPDVEDEIDVQIEIEAKAEE